MEYCFSKFSNRVLPPIFISTILQSVRNENLAHYFPWELRLLAQSFLANQKARNAIVGAENLLIYFSLQLAGRIDNYSNSMLLEANHTEM